MMQTIAQKRSRVQYAARRIEILEAELMALRGENWEDDRARKRAIQSKQRALKRWQVVKAAKECEILDMCDE
jgi:hypothetical protein